MSGPGAAGDTRPLRRVTVDPTRNGYDPDAWYFDIPAVAALRDRGLELGAGVTFLVGENGSGKSTLVEAIAAGWQALLGRHAPYWGQPVSPDVASLHRCLHFDALFPRPAGGFFLRAESMHGFFASIPDGDLRAYGGAPLNELSHGQSFLAVLRARANERGFYAFDEPEAALSFRSSLALLALLDVLRTEGSQAVVATHSPLLLALPGATILELDEHGIRETCYDDVDVVRDWRTFLAAPGRYLRHLLE